MKSLINKITFSLVMLLPSITSAYESPSVGIITPKTNDVPTIIDSIIGWILALVAGVAVLFIVIGGFKYVTSAGNKDQADSAKKTLTYAIIGLVIVVMAKIIVSLTTNSLGEII